MASIDKIFGTIKEFKELYNWLSINNPSLLPALYMDINDLPKDDGSSDYTIANFSSSADEWLYINCPLKFVKSRIRSQYNINTRLKWKFDSMRRIKNFNF